MCSPPPLCKLCWSATRPRLSNMHRFWQICSRQCISCYPEKRISCKPSGWLRRLWRRPWRGQAFCDQRPVHLRLPAVVGAHRKVRYDWHYNIGRTFCENTFLCTRNSFCFISFVTFDGWWEPTHCWGCILMKHCPFSIMLTSFVTNFPEPSFV